MCSECDTDISTNSSVPRALFVLGPCAGAAPPEPPSSESGRTAASPSGKDLDRPHTPVSPTAAADTIVDAGPGGEGSEEADPQELPRQL